MAQLLVRDLDDQAMARLKELARRNQRSLQAEARAILEAAAPRYTKRRPAARQTHHERFQINLNSAS